ncbi:unnamed protein product [Cuscuta campestris]|uniref:DUF1771 domain-containing protein n=1 Tax=Cuscuta campestris TaxID=132261 RepID=A0A484L640_9ASTE|nr:unnamed protein product [Cuscuta campestris]
MASFRPKHEPFPAKIVTDHYDHAKGDDYQVFREASKQHWESMKQCYQKAASASTNGKHQYAAYLFEQVCCMTLRSDLASFCAVFFLSIQY